MKLLFKSMAKMILRDENTIDIIDETGIFWWRNGKNVSLSSKLNHFEKHIPVNGYGAQTPV